jgi:hypothetical protein
MSVLESFYFTFAADASQLKKGLAEADKGSKDTEKSLQSADAVAIKLGTSFEKMAATAGKALAAIFSLHELSKLTQETADNTYAVYQQARAMNMSVESLSTWQQAVKSSGGTAEGATESISGLRDKFIEMARFGGMMGPEALMFEGLGLSAKDMRDSITNPMIAMEKLSDTFGKLDRTKALFIGKKLGLDQGTINLLMQGRRGLDEMITRQKELGVVTEAQAEAAAKFKLKEVELGIAFETVSRKITGAILPSITWLMNKLEDMIGFFSKHETFAVGFFGAIAGVITLTYLPAVVSAALATWALLAPYAAVAAGAALFALVLDDINSYMEGGDSIIGRAVKKWPMLGDVFHGIGVTVKFLNDTLIKLFDQVTHPAETLYGIFKALFDLFKNAPQNILNFIGIKTTQATGGGFPASKTSPSPDAAANVFKQSVTGKIQRDIPPEITAAAMDSEAKYGIPASVTIAQWKLESNSGKNMPTGSNNPFGIKAKAGQPFVESMTTEVINGQSKRIMQRFAKFDSLQDAFEAHAKLLATSGAYKEARNHENDPNAFADALTGVYATDPMYGSKLKNIMAQTSQPLPSMNSSSSSMSTTGDMNIHVDVGGVSTQAQDGEQVSKAIGDTLAKHLKNAIDGYDDGLAA